MKYLNLLALQTTVFLILSGYCIADEGAKDLCTRLWLKAGNSELLSEEEIVQLTKCKEPPKCESSVYLTLGSECLTEKSGNPVPIIQWIDEITNKPKKSE